MLKHYLTIALRTIKRYPVHTGIQLLGLGLGIAAFLLIVLFVEDNTGYDHYHEKMDRIGRLSNEMKLAGKHDKIAVTAIAPGPTMKTDYPEVEDAVRFMSAGNEVTIRLEDRNFSQSGFMVTDSSVFNIFSWPLLSGEKSTALTRPQTIVLSRNIAEKCFGGIADVVGKTLKVNQSEYEVTGIMEDIPDRSDIRPEALISFSSLPEGMRAAFSEDWFRMSAYTYLLFDKPENLHAFSPKLREVEKAYVKPFMAQNGVDGDLIYHLTPLEGLHLNNEFNHDSPKGDPVKLKLFSLVGFLVLLIACINYVNLGVAQATRRSREVGVRKTIGAYPRQLMMQHLAESLVMSLLALGIALLFAGLALKPFNAIMQLDFSFADLFRPTQLMTMAAVTLAVGLLAGSYPALFLASMKPARTLGGVLPKSARSWVRQGLVALQFTLSVALIVYSFTVYNQMNHLRDQKLGFTEDAVMLVEVARRDSTVQKALPALRERLLSQSGVSHVAAASRGSVPGRRTGELLFRVERDGLLVEKGINFMSVDEHYLDLMEIELVKGRNFDRARSTESQEAFLVNQALAANEGWKEAIDKRIQWGLYANDSAENDGRVVGVMHDFNFRSLHNPIEPLVFLFQHQSPSQLFVRFSEGTNPEEGRTSVESIWSEMMPTQPFRYAYLNETFLQQYNDDLRQLRLFAYLTGLTILIACIGLFGLSAFAVQQRSKEIGVRKVLGASGFDIFTLLSKNTVYMLLITFVPAFVIAFWYGKDWLENFHYRAGIPWWIFLSSALIALFAALATTGYHAWRANRLQPVETLRDE
ncbi:MAG: ABC transporter permease [Bacteroidia bacterium]